MHRVGVRARVAITEVPGVGGGIGGVIGEGDFSPIGFAHFILEAGNDLSRFWLGVFFAAHDDEADQQEKPQSLNRLVHGLIELCVVNQ